MKNKTLIYGALGVLAYLGYKKYSQKDKPTQPIKKEPTDNLMAEVDRLKALLSQGNISSSALNSKISSLTKEIAKREADKQKRLAEIERLQGSKSADDILRKRNDDLQRKIDELEREMGIKDANNKRILSDKEKELLDQIAKLKASITTKEDLIDTINAKRNAKVEMERLKTLEDFIGDSDEVIDKLTRTLDGIDTSTKAGQERAKVYIALIKKAEERKLKNTTSKSTIIELGLGRTGYQQLLPQANWTLNDLLDDSKHIQIIDRLGKYGDKAYYEFYPIDANVDFKQKGNWTSMLVHENRDTGALSKPLIVSVLNPTSEKMILGHISRNPKRYEVRIGGKSLDKIAS